MAVQRKGKMTFEELDGLNDEIQNINKHINISNNTELSNTFTFDLSLGTTFEIEIDDTEDKTIEFINIPTGLLWSTPIGIKVVCTALASITTYPTNSNWGEFDEPVFEEGKVYYLSFTRHGDGWHSGASGGYLNVIV